MICEGCALPMHADCHSNRVATEDERGPVPHRPAGYARREPTHFPVPGMQVVSLEIRINFRDQGWTWLFKDGDELQLWRNGQPLGALTAEHLRDVLGYHIRGIEMNAGLERALPGLAKPVKRLPDPGVLEALAENLPTAPSNEDLGF